MWKIRKFSYNRLFISLLFNIYADRKNVRFLKTNSGKKGEGMPVVRNQMFYFKEGFCWSNVLTTYIKCRKKNKTVHSTESMTFFSQLENIPEYYLISVLNSSLIARYVDSFVNSTSHFTTGDAKLVPIVMPTEFALKEVKKIYNEAIEIKLKEFSGTITETIARKSLERIQESLDSCILQLYGI